VDLLQMLEANGVPRQILEGLLDHELRKVRTLMSGVDSRNVRLLAEEELKLGCWEDASEGKKDGKAFINWGKIALQMISAGHSLNEPCLRTILQGRCKSKLKGLLKKIQIPLRDGECLFGIPDPTVPASLEEGQVYVRSKHISHSLPHDDGILVSRFPMGHPGDLQKLRHVDDKNVRQFLGERRNVIVFSVKGNRPAADMMPGGDYDGDIFFVLWSQAIVSSMGRSIPPAIQPRPNAASNASEKTPTKGCRAEDLIDARLMARRNTTMPRAANLRRVFADRYGAADKRCVELGQIYTDAIDADKTGARVEMPPEYSNFRQRPHWWSKPPQKGEVKYPSKSCVGKLYDQVQAALKDVNDGVLGSSLELDKDMLLDGREKHRDDAKSLLRHWGDSWKAWRPQNKSGEAAKKEAALFKEELISELRSRVFEELPAVERPLLASAVYVETQTDAKQPSLSCASRCAAQNLTT
jgi:hypothetical protein